MIRSKIAMGFLWAILARLGGLAWASGLVLALHLLPGIIAPAHAQGSRKDDIVFNSRGVPLAGATVRVCAMPATGQPCTPLALIYSDAGLTQALANPTTTDGLGNYFFYAAPGKYEIEISGPAITTKQIPNVILPSDPTAPTFSSLASTGNISAFSLSLSGNLTVNGNTTVAGSLASGTLNLSNQSTPPGAASTGTVNFYTKTADKRLYYKDDTGTEIGPVANTTGAQTNVSNTFTAPQNIDADFHTKGPNPWFDIMRYGARATSQNNPTTYTASCTSSSTTVALTSAGDLVNGDGITIQGCGPATTIASSPAPSSVTPTGLTGSTGYNYEAIYVDTKGGYAAVSASASTATGPAALGLNTCTVSTASRGLDNSSGYNNLVTVNFSAACNLTAGALFSISGLADASMNGYFAVNSVVSSTQITYKQGISGVSAGGSGGTLTVWAYNNIALAPPTNSDFACIYGGATGTFNFIGCTPAGQTGTTWYFRDYGSASSGQTVPWYLPSTPPSSAGNQYLTTTVSSGAGTTTIVVANAASNTISSQPARHDDGPALLAAFQAAGANGGIVFVPAPATNAFTFHVDSRTTLSAANAVSIVQVGAFSNRGTISVPAGTVWSGKLGSSFGNTPSFGFSGVPNFITYANPGILLPSNSSAVQFDYLKVSGTGSNAGVLILLEDNTTGISFDHMAIGSGSSAALEAGVLIHSGFDYYVSNSVLIGGSISTAAPPDASVFKFATGLPGSAHANQSSGDASFFNVNCTGRCVSFDGSTGESFGTSGAITWTRGIYQGGVVPWMSWVGNYTVAGYAYINQVDNADYSIPMIAAFNPSVANITMVNVSGSSSFVMVTGNAINNLYAVNSTGRAPCAACNGIGQNFRMTDSEQPQPYFGNKNTRSNSGYISTGFTRQNQPVLFSGGDTDSDFISYPLSNTAGAPSCSLVAGGSLTVGTAYTVEVDAADWEGRTTLLGAASNSVTPTSGNQSISCTWTAMSNVAGYHLWFNENGGGFLRWQGASDPPFTTASGTITSRSFDAASTQSVGVACATCASVNGFTAPSFRLAGSGETFSNSPRGEENVFLPGALTSAWTGGTWTIDKAIAVTRVEVQAKTAPSGCTTNAIVRVTDGTTPINVTISAAASTSGAIAQNYAAGAALTISVQTAAAGCTASPADANVVVQYRMQ